uniref:hypothetical protein n=1 Tax=Pantoea sp. IMH TaxID=1267600 RepID=UPI0004693551|nr:hypothetical protein [Pantoea sp. IMH]
MKLIKNFVAASALSLIAFASFAQTVTVTAPTLAGAEAKIASQAKASGTSYKITGARVDNHAYVSAQLSK